MFFFAGVFLIALVFVAFLLVKSGREVPAGSILVVGNKIIQGPTTHYRPPWDETPEEEWRIAPQNHSIPTQLGSFLIGWEPLPHRFLDFVYTGGDPGIRAKVEEMISKNAEIIQKDVLAVDEDGKLRHEPTGLLKAWADDLGVVWRNVHVPTRWRRADFIDSTFIDGAREVVKRTTRLFELHALRDEVFNQRRDYISQVDAERTARGQRTLTEDLEQIFNVQEGKIVTEGVPSDKLPKDIP